MGSQSTREASGAPLAPTRPAWRREVLLACLLGLVVAFAAMWKPLLSIRTHTLGSWEGLAQQNPLLVDGLEPLQRDSTGGDPLRQFVPWALFARSEFAHGRWPLWDPHCGTGVPVLGNLQSEVLSPFTLP